MITFIAQFKNSEFLLFSDLFLACTVVLGESKKDSQFLWKQNGRLSSSDQGRESLKCSLCFAPPLNPGKAEEQVEVHPYKVDILVQKHVLPKQHN